MDALRKKLTRILKKHFPKPGIVSLQEADGYVGLVISSRFRRLDGRERVDLVNAALNAGLTPEEQRQVYLIIGITPEEEIQFDKIPGPNGEIIYRKTI